VTDVPVDGFWSIIVYDIKRLHPKNGTSLFAQQHHGEEGADGSSPSSSAATMARHRTACPSRRVELHGRLYRLAEILNGKWMFPEASQSVSPAGLPATWRRLEDAYAGGLPARLGGEKGLRA